MNCKPGDLAMVVYSTCGNEGRLVNVLRPAVRREIEDWAHSDEGHHWWCEVVGSPMKDTFGDTFMDGAFPDVRLRPIRPGDISDEEVRDLYAPKVPEAA